MKRISLIINVALGSLIIFYACRTETKKDDASFTRCIDCTKDDFHGLSAKFFFQGIARYKTTHWDMLDKNPMWKSEGMEDARACWYSIDTLKKYICLIEKYSSKMGIQSDQLGIRFYYATYPANLEKKEYRSHHTLFMAPTYHDLSGEDIDFDPKYSFTKNEPSNAINRFPGVNRKLFTLSELDSLNVNESTFILGGTLNGEKNEDPQKATKNQGRLCPPTCPPPDASTLNHADNTYKGVNYQD